MPECWSRSVGKTSGSSEASGSIVVAMAQYYTSRTDDGSRNTDVAGADRPLTARSIIASALLGTHPPVLRGQLMVRLVELFGVPEGTTGWRCRAWSPLASSRSTRAGNAREPALLARSGAEGGGRSTCRPVDGEWVMAVVTVDRRDALPDFALREAASALRLAELREGVWMRPRLEWGARDQLAVIGEQCTWMTATPDDPVAIAASLWDLDGWAANTKALVARMKRSHASLDRDGFDAIPEGFVTWPRCSACCGLTPCSEHVVAEGMAGRGAANPLRRLRRHAAATAAGVQQPDARPPYHEPHPHAARARHGPRAAGG